MLYPNWFGYSVCLLMTDCFMKLHNTVFHIRFDCELAVASHSIATYVINACAYGCNVMYQNLCAQPLVIIIAL